MFDDEDLFLWMKRLAGAAAVIFCLYGGMTLYSTRDLGQVLKMCVGFVLGVVALGVVIFLLNRLLGHWSSSGSGARIGGVLLAIVFVAVSCVLMHELGCRVGYHLMVWVSEKLETLLDKVQLPMPDVSGAQAGCGIAGVVAALLVGLIYLMKVTNMAAWIPTLFLQSVLTLAFCFYTHIVLLIAVIVIAMVIWTAFGAIMDAVDVGYSYARRAGYSSYASQRASWSILSILHFLGRGKDD